MGIKITINNSEVKNPIIRFLVTLVLLCIFSVLAIVVLFFILPVLWFSVAAIMLLVAALLSAAPKLRTQYKIIMLERKKIDDKTHPSL